MGQRYVCTFRHAQRAAYRAAISAAQILVIVIISETESAHERDNDKDILTCIRKLTAKPAESTAQTQKRKK